MGKILILLVEDDKDLCASTKGLLELSGFEAKIEMTATAAFCILTMSNKPGSNKKRIDAVLCEVNLKKDDSFENGLEMIRAAKGALSKNMPPVIFWSSGLPDGVSVEQLLLVGDDFFFKPAPFKKLQAAIERILSQFAPEQKEPEQKSPAEKNLKQKKLEEDDDDYETSSIGFI